MQNETQTTTDNDVNVMADLTLDETAPAQVKGGSVPTGTVTFIVDGVQTRPNAVKTFICPSDRSV
ncbi:MAG: hypothetical protein ACKVZH_29560 [Blastocatellia bacterium]